MMAIHATTLILATHRMAVSQGLMNASQVLFAVQARDALNHMEPHVLAEFATDMAIV